MRVDPGFRQVALQIKTEWGLTYPGATKEISTFLRKNNFMGGIKK